MVQTMLRGGTALLDASRILSRIGVQQGMIVADLGCGGGGHFVTPASKMVGPSGHVYALDIQKSVLHTVESKLKLQHITNADLVWSDLEKVGAASIPDGCCDIVLLANVLFQNKNHGAIISEASRMLKKDGRLAILEWKRTASPLGPPLEYRVDNGEMKTLATGVGLHFLDEFDPGAYHTCLLFSKPGTRNA